MQNPVETRSSRAPQGGPGLVKVLKALLCSSLLASAASMAGAGDWPRWRGPDLNGISSETGWTAHWPAEGPRQIWKTTVGTGFSSLAVSKGRVYTMGNARDTEAVYCLDAETGRELWVQFYSCPVDPNMYEGGPSATPTVDAGRVFTLSRRGDLFCFEAESGKIIWQKNIASETGAARPTWGFAGSPLVEGDLLILNVGSAGTALEKATGKLVWQSGKNPAGYSTPVPLDWEGERYVLLFGQQALTAVHARSGKALWSHPWKTPHDINAADPIVAGDKVFLSSGYHRGGAVLKLTSAGPRVLWENKDMRNQFNPSVLIGNKLYGFDGNSGQGGALKCVDFESGVVHWAEPKISFGALMAAGQNLIVLSERGELLAGPASPAAFKPTSRAQVLGGRCWTTPVLANGRLYCRNSRGDIVCLDVVARDQAALK
jgi:outer membrane protein assembly factor BamB